jgi:hypothetical protein
VPSECAMSNLIGLIYDAAGDSSRWPVFLSSFRQTLRATGAAVQRNAVAFEYHVNLPNGIMLVDSEGRRTGKDPATGTIPHYSASV